MIRTKLTNRSTICFLACLTILGLPAIVVGDETSGQKQNVPHGNVAEISDWALAGVVWSDASLAKKLAVAAAKQTKDKERLADLQKQVQRFDGILAAMKQFGWQQLHQAPTSSPIRGQPAASDLEGADSRYRESVAQAQAIDKGVENGPDGPAAAANLAEFSGLAEKSYTRRDAETLSSSSPYSRNSLYHIEEYDPGSISSDTNVGSANAPAVAPNNAVDSIVANEVGRLRSSENRTLQSLQGNQLPKTNMSHFTQTDGNLQSDANWVQFQLDINQARWDQMASSTISDEMLADVINQLKARMQLAARFTKSDQLRAALTQ